MTISLLLLTCLLLSPWAIQCLWYVTSRPEAVPTPSWMVTSTILVLFVSPLISGLASGENFSVYGRSAAWIAYTAFCYWITFTAVYRLLAWNNRTIQPDGPRGMQTVFGMLKKCVLAMSLPEALSVFVPIMVIKLLFMKYWGLGLSGGGSVMIDLPYHLTIIYLLTSTGLVGFTAFFAARLLGRSSPVTKAVCAGGLLANLGFAIVAGRRPMLIFLGLFAMGMMWTGRRRNVLAIAGLAFAAWFILAVFSPVFLRARALWRLPNGPDVVTAFRIAIQEGDTKEASERLQKESEQNIAARMNSYSFWLQFYDAYIAKPLGGLILAQAILMNIPRAFIGMNKYALGPTEEYLFGTGDIANNVCLESFIDLGPFGPFVYGAIFGAMFVVIEWLLAWVAARSRYVAVVASSMMIEPMVSPEADVMAYLSLLRNVLTFCVVAGVLSLVVGRKPAIGDRPGGSRQTAWSGLPPPPLAAIR